MRLPILLLTMAVLSPAPGRAASHGPDVCAVPESLLVDHSSLPRVEGEIKAKKRLTIVAIGSSSTWGAGLTSQVTAWPAQLETELKKVLHGIQIKVVNKAKQRQSAAEMLAALSKDIAKESPSLVIWESGTFEAMRRTAPEDFGKTLMTGVERLTAQGADVALMDMQFARPTAGLIDFEPYLGEIARVSEVKDLLRFPRFEIMRVWAEDNRFDFDLPPGPQQRAIADEVHSCLARHLAAMIAQALEPK